MRSKRVRLALVGLAVSLVGCNGDGASGAEASKTAWQPCNETFECATVEVPVDYDQPDGPKIPIAIMRAPAMDPESRVGAIVINPGGPGSPMVARLVEEYWTMRLAFPEVFQRFDLVAFDWRGVGKSAPLGCVDGAFFDELRGASLALQSSGDVEHVEQLRKTFSDGCRASASDAMLQNLHTENAARDLDRIRQALGEEKLTYLGLSYGTWLGATYATLFPERVRALVLDAPVFLPADSGVQIERRAKSLDEALGRFFASCGDDASCAFHGGEGVEAVASAFDAVIGAVSRGEIADRDRTLSPTDASLAVVGALRSHDRRDLAVDLAKAEAGDGSALRALADAAAGKRADGTYDGSIQGLIAIGSLDLPMASGTTTTDMQSFVDRLRGESRSALGAAIPWALAVDWPWRRARPALPISATAAPPMLVVSTRHDPLSVEEDAARMLDAFGNGSHLLTYEGDGHVAILRSACVRSLVSDYLFDPSKKPRTTTCTPD